MEKLEDYIVPLHGLKEGTHTYTYKLNNEFLKSFEEHDIEIVNVDVTVELIKNLKTVECIFKVKGKVDVPCDRCLEKMTKKVKHEAKLIVKLGEQYQEISEEILEIPEYDDFDMAHIVFEYLMLCLPLRTVHKKGECDPKMIEILHKYSANNDQTDHRWDDLKKLLDNN